MKKGSIVPTILITGLCFLILVIVACTYFGAKAFQKYLLPTLTTNFNIPPIVVDKSTPTPFVVTRQPVEEIPLNTLQQLQQIKAPDADYYDLACRLQDVCGVPRTMDGPSAPLEVGAQETFWVLNTDSQDDFQVHAILRYVTEHAYFWAEDGAEYSNSDMRTLMDTFENKIYPTDRELFGSEWTPGVDGDPHIYILYAGNIGWGVAGYFFANNEYLPAIREHSNAHEMFVINTSQDLGNSYTYTTLAHEFQHMIHWHQDTSESELFDEGFAELAGFVNGYDVSGSDWFYTTNPDTNLTDWHINIEDNSIHYGANFLFTNYFLNRFGKELTQTLVHNQESGLNSVDEVLSQHSITDPVTGRSITADDFFQDWTLANYLQDPSVGDGRYAYQNYPRAPQTDPSETITTCPIPLSSRTVNQYGVDYIRFTCDGSYTIHFSGATSVPLLPADPHSGKYALWSNKGNNTDMTLTREFDFTGVASPITITYWTWYDIEEDWDYVYLEASTDGEHWQILPTPSGTAENPLGNSFGWGYTGASNQWIEESVDLSQFAGQKVTLRFEYVTDMAVNGEGFLFDEVSIPAIGYSTNFDTDSGGWESAGFIRVENVIPQTFRLALITRSSSGTTIQYIPISTDQTAEIPFTIGKDGAYEVVLVVSGTTRFTRSTAGYEFEVK